jgi:hypothetical protein
MKLSIIVSFAKSSLGHHWWVGIVVCASLFQNNNKAKLSQDETGAWLNLAIVFTNTAVKSVQNCRYNRAMTVISPADS